MSNFRRAQFEAAEAFEKEKETNDAVKSRSTFFTSIFVGVLIVIAVLFNASGKEGASTTTTVDTTHYTMHNSLRTKATKKSSLSSDVNFSLKRVGYDALRYFNADQTSHLKYGFLTDYQAIIEPYVPMELTMYDLSSGLSDDSVSYEAVICPITDPSDECQTAKMYYEPSFGSTITTSVTFECTASDTFSMTLYTLDKDGAVTSQVTNKALCMYVRREIRDYSKADLDRFLDVMYLLSNTTLSEGQEKYGSDFYDVKTLAKLHYWNAGQRDADHIHEGTGFLTQHLKLTNLFEMSVQSVDPSLAVPYWDFTIDNQTGWKIFDAFVSSPDVFGTVSYPQSSNRGFGYEADTAQGARIPDGRWANQLVEMNTEFPSLKTGYGYLRAPWVLNPSPYTSRYSFDWEVDYSYLPSCENNYDILEYTDMMSYFYQMSYGPHGTAHITYGGIFGCDALDHWVTDGIIADADSQLLACSKMGNIIKEFYRHGFVNPPTSCTLNEADYTASDCLFTCREDKLEIATYSLYYLLEGTYNSSTSEPAIRDFLGAFICSDEFSKMYVGDHYESSSMSDPSFWVMHPTLERLTHAKLLSGGFDDETWSTDPVNDFVCTKSSCYDEVLDESDYFADCCYGHYEYDQMYNGFKGTRDDYFGITNHEAFVSTDPRNASSYAMSYIYNDFTFDHCSKTDYDVDGLLVTLYTESFDSAGKPKKRTMSAGEKKTKKRMQEIVDANRKTAELSIARKAAKQAREEEEAKKSGSKHVAHTPKKTRKVLPNSPSQLIKQEHKTN